MVVPRRIHALVWLRVLVSGIGTLVLAVLLSAGPANVAQGAQRFIPLLQPGDTVPPIGLIDEGGRPFQLSDLRSDALAVSFIYTRCADPHMCPLVTAKFARAQAAIRSAAIHLVLITLDPRFDSAAVLARYGRGFGQDRRHWTLATGAPSDIEDLAGRLGIATAVTQPGVVVHTEGTIVIAPGGRIARTLYGNDWSPAELIASVRATLPSSTDRLSDVRAWLSSAVERCGGGGLALNGAALLGLLALAIAGVGGAFWLAFRTRGELRKSNS